MIFIAGKRWSRSISCALTRSSEQSDLPPCWFKRLPVVSIWQWVCECVMYSVLQYSIRKYLKCCKDDHTLFQTPIKIYITVYFLANVPQGIFQAVYTAGALLPRPISICRWDMMQHENNDSLLSQLLPSVIEPKEACRGWFFISRPTNTCAVHLQELGSFCLAL